MAFIGELFCQLTAQELSSLLTLYQQDQPEPEKWTPLFQPGVNRQTTLRRLRILHVLRTYTLDTLVSIPAGILYQMTMDELLSLAALKGHSEAVCRLIDTYEFDTAARTYLYRTLQPRIFRSVISRYCRPAYRGTLPLEHWFVGSYKLDNLWSLYMGDDTDQLIWEYIKAAPAYILPLILKHVHYSGAKPTLPQMRHIVLSFFLPTPDLPWANLTQLIPAIPNDPTNSLLDLLYTTQKDLIHDPHTHSNLTPTTTEEACPICLDTAGEFSATACQHVFHNQCITTWLVDHDTCPVCRSALIS